MVIDFKEIVGCILLVGLSVIIGELIPTDDTVLYGFFPIAMGAMMGISALAQGIGGSAKAAAANQQAQQQHTEQLINKSYANGREIFQAVHSEMQQAKRNREIAESAHLFKAESMADLGRQNAYLQNELSSTLGNNQAVLSSSLAAQNSVGGTAKVVQKSLLLKGLSGVMNLEENERKAAKNIDRQFSNMMSQRTQDVYIPNINGVGPPPVQQDTTMPLISGVIGGVASGMGGFASGTSAGLG